MRMLELELTTESKWSSSPTVASSTDSFSKLEILDSTRFERTDWRGISLVRPSSSSRAKSSTDMFDCYAGIISSFRESDPTASAVLKLFFRPLTGWIRRLLLAALFAATLFWESWELLTFAWRICTFIFFWSWPCSWLLLPEVIWLLTFWPA